MIGIIIALVIAIYSWAYGFLGICCKKYASVVQELERIEKRRIEIEEKLI